MIFFLLQIDHPKALVANKAELFSEAEEDFADGGEDDNDIPVEGHYPAKKLRRWKPAPIVPEGYGKPGEMGK